MHVMMEMPDQAARQWGATPDAVGRHVMEDAAIRGLIELQPVLERLQQTNVRLDPQLIRARPGPRPRPPTKVTALGRAGEF
jgi:hypothetical protein